MKQKTAITLFRGIIWWSKICSDLLLSMRLITSLPLTTELIWTGSCFGTLNTLSRSLVSSWYKVYWVPEAYRFIKQVAFAVYNLPLINIGRLIKFVPFPLFSFFCSIIQKLKYRVGYSKSDPALFLPDNIDRYFI